MNPLALQPAHGPAHSFGVDAALDTVIGAITALDASGERFATVLRDTLDQLYDGQRTGRYQWQDLRKTEKTYMGTLVEINIHRAFDFEDGSTMDYRIEGTDVDCKYSQTLGGWEFPPEAYEPGHICLVIWANDETSLWNAGVIRLKEELLGAPNRDMKRKLLALGRQQVRWLFDHQALPENLLLHIDPETRGRIFNAGSGQARVNMLFRMVQRRLVNRGSVLTVAQQKDSLKRARDARLPQNLGNEGIVVLGHQEQDPVIAEELGLPVPTKGGFVSARLARSEQTFLGKTVELGSVRWRLADDSDPVIPAPPIPRGRAHL